MCSKTAAAGVLLLLLASPLAAFAAPPPPPKKAVAPPREGIASWYRARRPMSAAHRTLPIGTKVWVIAKNGRSVVVTITGRGPFVKGRILDLSSDAFKRLASLGTGLLRVRWEFANRTAGATTTKVTIRNDVQVHARR